MTQPNSYGASSGTTASKLAQTFGPSFLTKTALAAAISGVVFATGLAFRFGSPFGVGFAVGLAWGLANGWALAFLLRSMTSGATRGKIPVVIFLKFAVYGLGIWLLVSGLFPPVAMVMGFSWLFVVLVLRALGAMFLHSSIGTRKSVG
ncbi:MAG: hypothetical protein HKN21_12510 [Candidatus Eisenbacteria bacterium]|uniref:ATP synthase subunit I n=1 Tax=Eiseniibacteriota bacterium TaxID=2212470 RepID=A0A7Y2E999_UNCEI|nr:hypothetical protein [Candidatus Eisenbacteria bacterium]